MHIEIQIKAATRAELQAAILVLEVQYGEIIWTRLPIRPGRRNVWLANGFISLPDAKTQEKANPILSESAALLADIQSA